MAILLISFDRDARWGAQMLQPPSFTYPESNPGGRQQTAISSLLCHPFTSFYAFIPSSSYLHFGCVLHQLLVFVVVYGDVIVIMSDVLEEHEGTVILSIAGRTITNLRFADDIDGLAGSEQELAQLVERIETSLAYGMTLKNKTNDYPHQWHSQRNKGKWPETSNCYQLQIPGPVIHHIGCRIQSRNVVKNCPMHYRDDKTETIRTSHSYPKSDSLMRTLIISILLYACETWTLTIELQRRIKAV